LIRVQQFLPHLHRGDAIGDSTRLMAESFRKWGHESAIYCYGADPGLLGDGVYRVEAYRPSSEVEIQILHYALPSPLSAWFARLPGRRVLIHHNLTPARHFAGLDPEMAEIVQRGEQELRELAAAVDLGLGDSEWNRQELERFGARRTGVLPILVDFTRYDLPPRPALLRMLRDGMHNLLFVGRLAPNKSHEELLKAFKLYQKHIEPRSRLILVGKPDRNHTYAAALLELVRDERIDNVHFAGGVDHKDLCTYYRAADLFVCASRHEGFCVPLLEAFHFELPVIARHAAAVPFTLGGAGLSFAGFDPAELAELFDLALHDRRLRQAVLERQRRRLADFTRDRVEMTLKAAIEGLL
jgi:glycosyltransferase involved in cell wall biosynthesis